MADPGFWKGEGAAAMDIPSVQLVLDTWLLRCSFTTDFIGANCTDMVGTLTIRRLLSPVPPDGNFQ